MAGKSTNDGNGISRTLKAAAAGFILALPVLIYCFSDRARNTVGLWQFMAGYSLYAWVSWLNFRDRFLTGRKGSKSTKKE